MHPQKFGKLKPINTTTKTLLLLTLLPKAAVETGKKSPFRIKILQRGKQHIESRSPGPKPQEEPKDHKRLRQRIPNEDELQVPIDPAKMISTFFSLS